MEGNADGATPLFIANQGSLVELLVQCHADVNLGLAQIEISNPLTQSLEFVRGISPLYNATVQGWGGAMECLLHYGANLGELTEVGAGLLRILTLTLTLTLIGGWCRPPTHPNPNPNPNPNWRMVPASYTSRFKRDNLMPLKSSSLPEFLSTSRWTTVRPLSITQ